MHKKSFWVHTALKNMCEYLVPRSSAPFSKFNSDTKQNDVCYNMHMCLYILAYIIDYLLVVSECCVRVYVHVNFHMISDRILCNNLYMYQPIYVSYGDQLIKYLHAFRHRLKDHC